MNIFYYLNVKYHSFINGIKNLIRWFPIVWKDRDFDHAYIEYILQFKLQKMYNRLIVPTETCINWESEHASKCLKALRICINILKRRRSEFYVNLWDSDKEELTDDIMVKIDSLERRDWKMFHNLMEKYMECWWD